MNEKYGIRESAELSTMQMKDGTSFYIDEDRNDGCADEKQLMSLLEEINVLCRDDGKQFDKNNSARVSVIEEKLKDTDYKITKGKIFLLCHKKDLTEYEDGVVLISSHIDCKRPHGVKGKGITRCFSKLISDNLLLGTYDNSITNTAILYLMMNEKLPENVIVAFTGDEEEGLNGASKVTKLLKNHNLKFKCMVLDVTDAGWNEQVDFTIENNFWGGKMGKQVIETVKKSSSNWIFVPEEMDNIPSYVSDEFVYYKKSDPDESWEYDEYKIKCFSLCLPVDGEMHSDDGVFARINSFEKYTEILQILASVIK